MNSFNSCEISSSVGLYWTAFNLMWPIVRLRLLNFFLRCSFSGGGIFPVLWFTLLFLEKQRRISSTMFFIFTIFLATRDIPLGRTIFSLLVYRSCHATSIRCFCVNYARNWSRNSNFTSPIRILWVAMTATFGWFFFMIIRFLVVLAGMMSSWILRVKTTRGAMLARSPGFI